MFKVSHENKEHLLEIYLNGRLDTSSCKELEEYLLNLIEHETFENLKMNCKDLVFISSGGLRVFLLVAKKIKLLNRNLELSQLNLNIKEIFDVSGFTQLFKIN